MNSPTERQYTIRFSVQEVQDCIDALRLQAKSGPEIEDSWQYRYRELANVLSAMLQPIPQGGSFSQYMCRILRNVDITDSEAEAIITSVKQRVRIP